MIKENDYRDEKGSEYIQGGKTCIQSLEEKNWQTEIPIVLEDFLLKNFNI